MVAAQIVIRFDLLKNLFISHNLNLIMENLQLREHANNSDSLNNSQILLQKMFSLQTLANDSSEDSYERLLNKSSVLNCSSLQSCTQEQNSTQVECNSGIILNLFEDPRSKEINIVYTLKIFDLLSLENLTITYHYLCV